MAVIDDSDGDGLIDLVEYLVAGSSLTQDGSDSIGLDADSREFTLRRDSANADLILRLLVSDDLENWTPIAVSYEGNSFSTTNGLTATDSALNGSLVETKITISPTNETKKFAKARDRPQVKKSRWTRSLSETTSQCLPRKCYSSCLGREGCFSINDGSGKASGEALSRASNFLAVTRRRLSRELTALL